MPALQGEACLLDQHPPSLPLLPSPSRGFRIEIRALSSETSGKSIPLSEHRLENGNTAFLSQLEPSQGRASHLDQEPDPVQMPFMGTVASPVCWEQHSDFAEEMEAL